MARITEMHKKWLKEPKYKKAYDALEEEFVLAGAVMDVRNRAGLTQEELARRMGTTQPAVARLESGRSGLVQRPWEQMFGFQRHQTPNIAATVLLCMNL
ncbi:MAG TPA: helix-turn-helix transcriptional regulator [Candidatus Saccharimonadales bacterium]|jgi:DNA-binding XRE family transcriptional regulator|nr:helix-turn-helix transcriptional regulator [Candidatus Saccharimonadales bacterium]